jgi:hypothetical protein
MELIDAKLLWNDAIEFDPKLPKQISIISMKSRELPWQAELMNSDFSPHLWWLQAEPMRRLAYMFGKFQYLVIGGGLPPNDTHEAFMEIDEYRRWHEQRGILFGRSDTDDGDEDEE